MKVAVPLYETDGNAEERREPFGGENVLFETVGQDLAFAQKHDALNLRNDFRDVMSNEQNTEAAAREFAHGIAQLELCCDVQGIARLVEKQGLWVVDERASDQRALCFTGRHLRDCTTGEMSDSQASECGFGALQMLWIGMMVRKNTRAAEKPGKNNIASRGVRGAGSQQIRRDDTKQRAQLENVPPLAAQDGDRRAFPRQGIAFARDRFDQRGFPATVRAEDANVFTGTDSERYTIERRPFGGRSAHHSNVMEC